MKQSALQLNLSQQFELPSGYQVQRDGFRKYSVLRNGEVIASGIECWKYAGNRAIRHNQGLTW